MSTVKGPLISLLLIVASTCNILQSDQRLCQVSRRTHFPHIDMPIGICLHTFLDNHDMTCHEQAQSPRAVSGQKLVQGLCGFARAVEVALTYTHLYISLSNPT